MLEQATLEYGVLGVVVVGLGWAVISLWNRYNAVQDARIEDTKMLAETAKDQIRSVERLTETMAALADRVDRLGGQ